MIKKIWKTIFTFSYIFLTAFTVLTFTFLVLGTHVAPKAEAAFNAGIELANWQRLLWKIVAVTTTVYLDFVDLITIDSGESIIWMIVLLWLASSVYIILIKKSAENSKAGFIFTIILFVTYAIIADAMYIEIPGIHQLRLLLGKVLDFLWNLFLFVWCIVAYMTPDPNAEEEGETA